MTPTMIAIISRGLGVFAAVPLLLLVTRFETYFSDICNVPADTQLCGEVGHQTGAIFFLADLGCFATGYVVYRAFLAYLGSFANEGEESTS